MEDVEEERSPIQSDKQFTSTSNTPKTSSIKHELREEGIDSDQEEYLYEENDYTEEKRLIDELELQDIVGEDPCMFEISNIRLL
ncbi:unnamed protein product [Didymodactylos carnosus]|uniref:Uncharacterized protein n=1 Tax=Didymodactylos carnosus TaxID=1234261 RepID=A0A813ULM8_9BILA|nr:unnamed protein product [Didymodactylos carnosus]CAF3615404.1 unnamed protein product [Didymodactylos carnosus]